MEYRTFKDRCQYLDNISVEYKKASLTLDDEGHIKNTSLIKEDGGCYYLSDEKIESYKFFKQHVDRVLQKLDPVEKEFIENDYFHKKSSIWWVSCYSKSSYYRNKKKALEIFLQYYKL